MFPTFPPILCPVPVLFVQKRLALSISGGTAIFDQITQEHIDYMLSKIPRGRFVKVAEIAALVAWLASAENSFTTAGVFDISGGRATY